MRLTLLGPQRRPSVDAVARSLDLAGPVATVTAGWRERESDDGELTRLLGGRDVNLRLYERWADVAAQDPSFAHAERRLRELHEEAQQLYLLRLGHALAAVHDLARRAGDGPLAEAALAEAIGTVRELDALHVRRVSEIEAEFWAVVQPEHRPLVAAHRAEVAGLLAGAGPVAAAAALVIAGGHVGVLVHAMRVFGVAEVARAARTPVIAWSAGAMALADRIVLFHDRAPQGPGHPEVYGAGLGLVHNLVLLPHARARLLLDDHPRMAVFARRFAPAQCVLLETGTRIDTGADGGCPPGTRVLAADGSVTALEAA